MSTRRSSSLFLALLLTSALFVSLYSVTIPSSAAATLTIIPSSLTGKSGDVITFDSSTGLPTTSVDGTACTAVGSVANLVKSPTATVSGGVVYGSFVVGDAPAAAGGFAYTVTVKCPSTGIVVDSGSTPFTPDPKLTISPSIGVQGAIVAATGVGFWSDATSCTLTGATVVLLGSDTCSLSGGSMSGHFTVDPAAADAVHVITVTPSAGLPVSGNFQKVSAPTIVASPSSVPLGFGTQDGAVLVTGGGFSSGISRSCQLTGSTGLIATSPAPTCSISSTGTVSATFAVPITAPLGAVTVQVTDTNPVGAFATTPFIVLASPTLLAAAPATGPPGTPVTLTSGPLPFAVEDVGVCTISSTPTGLISAPACFIDEFGVILVGAFTVSSTPAGQIYVVTVTGLHGDRAITAFSVTPSITLNPTSGSPAVGGSPGAPATEVTVSGVGFSTADTSCTITAAATSTGILNIDTTGEPPCTVSAGVLTAKFKVGAGSTYDPAGTPQYTITVTGNPATDSATATFDVKPQMVLSPTYGPTGTPVTAYGSGFDTTIFPGLCTLSSNPPNLDGGFAVCTLNNDGTIVATFTVDPLLIPLPNGNYTVTIYGSTLGVDEVSAMFAKTGSMNLLPTSGRLGTNVLISGSGFNPLDTGCTIISYPSGLISNPLCTVAGGSLSGSFTVASGAGGAYLVKVVGTSGDEGRATFTVPSAPTLSLNPISGQVGAVVSASGQYYQGTTCLITATPSGLFASQSCSIVAGTLTGSFSVSASAAPATLYTVTVQTNAGAGDSATATFAVTAGPTSSLTLTPTTGPAGAVVSGKGTGFPTDTSCVLISAPSNIFSSQSCTVAGGNATVGFTVSSSTATGSYVILVLGNMGRSASASFTVTATPLFSLSANPSSVVLSPGGTGSVTVTVLSVGGFNSPVTLAASLPAGVTGGFSPNPVTPPAGGSVTSTLSIAVPSASASSTTAITIAGTGGGSTATASITLVIQVFVTSTATFVTSTATSSATSTTTLSTTTAPWTLPKPCIIATATFGSEASSAVQFLRNFRDGLVLSTKAGSAFMEVFNAWYYSFSPSVAGFIAGNDPLRAPVRALLYPLLGVLGITTLTYSAFSAAPEFAIVAAGLVASSLIGLVYLTLPAMLAVKRLSKRKAISVSIMGKGSLALLVTALAMLAAGELAGSFVLLAIGSSVLVLTCIVTVPVLAALAILRPIQK